MEFGKPQKLPDGRYFLKITAQVLQVNNVKIREDLTSPSLTIEGVPESLVAPYDTAILAEALKSKVEWFGRELSDETIQGAYQESLTDGALGATPAKAKGQNVIRAFDAQKEPVETSVVSAGTPCDLLIELAGLWFLKKSFGPVWRVLQVRIRKDPVKKAPAQYAFTDDPEEVEAEDEDDPTDYMD